MLLQKVQIMLVIAFCVDTSILAHLQPASKIVMKMTATISVLIAEKPQVMTP